MQQASSLIPYWRKNRGGVASDVAGEVISNLVENHFSNHYHFRSVLSIQTSSSARSMAPANPPVRSSASPGYNDLPAMFRPPVNRAMRVLDRSFFRKTVPISAAAIYKASDISNVRRVLLKNHDMLSLPRASSIREVRDQEDSSVVRKGILLREDIKHDGTDALVIDCDLEEAIADYGLSRCCNVVV